MSGREHPVEQSARTAAGYLAEAERVLVLTGAGMSAESGVPTFRGAGGLWNDYRPEDLATPEAFRRDPELVWKWYQWRRDTIAGVEPHPGHRVLADWEQELASLTIVTQNVDGLHQRAGSRNVIELHGRIDRAYCARCGYEVMGLQDLGEDPRCPQCGLPGARLRPGVVWFGERLPPQALQAAAEAAQLCDVCFVIGTSAVVEPAASLIGVAMSTGGKTVEINLERTPYSDAMDVSLRQPCGAALEAIERYRRSLVKEKET